VEREAVVEARVSEVDEVRCGDRHLVEVELGREAALRGICYEFGHEERGYTLVTKRERREEKRAGEGVKGWVMWAVFVGSLVGRSVGWLVG